MSNPIKLRIIQWNLKRNDLKFDPKLELKMLSEEAREFYTAETKAERLREYADFLFVMTGTYAKFSAQEYSTTTEFKIAQEQWQEMWNWISRTRMQMAELLEEEGVTVRHIDSALMIITKANEAKTAEKVDGKVVKGEAYQDPILLIEDLLGEEEEI